MRQSPDGLVFSPTDLNAFLACPHLTALELAVKRGELARPHRVNLHADLIRRKGDEHEARYLEELRVEGREITEIFFKDRDFERAARETEAAIQSGVDVIYQACFWDGTWRGFADFVERLPAGPYEVVDTKLARRARPAHVLQLCFYTEQLARIQGRRPELMHVVNGLGERESFRPGDYEAYYRRLQRRFLAAVASGLKTYPLPVEHCGICDWLERCQAQWGADDHLVLVAGASRLQVERLENADIRTLTALAEAPPDLDVRSMRPATFERLRSQAALQLHYRETGERQVVELPLEDDRGFALLPEPSPGDIWLDFEGDPWFEPGRGLEFLTGWLELAEDGEPVYRSLRAATRDEERAAFEAFVDHVVERRRRFPGMHVHHYAPYERTALTRLMGEHATREEEIDDLLRGEVLVDLYRITRQALRASVPSYSLKEVEKLFGFERTAEVGGGSKAVRHFETYLETGEESLLEGIDSYNREDCVATYELHRWLLERRPDIPWRPLPDERERSEEAEERDAETARVRARLLASAEEGEPRWLLAQLLDYHRREEKPQWWEYFFHLKELDDEEYVTNRNTLGGLLPAGEPELEKRSWWYPFTFEAQEHKISGTGVDPRTERRFDVRVDDEHGTLWLRWGEEPAEEPLPTALIPPVPYNAKAQKEALLRLAENQEQYPAGVAILERRPPRADLGGSLSEAARLWEDMERRARGDRAHAGGEAVGVTALSHKAIHKFLDDLEEAADEAGFEFRGMKKGAGEGHYENRFVECTNSNDAMLDPELQLLAGTSWLFARGQMDQHVNTLFVDEGGQFALADALAVATSARNLVLLGDPNQLPQVSQGSHPPGAEVSVLGHLLGSDATVRPEMGVFLERTWRMRPEVNAYVSETFYEGRLEPASVTSERSVADGNGVRFLPVEHVGHSQAAPEEADAIRAEIERLVGTLYMDGGVERPLRYEDFIVVAPYNAHVRCLREKLPEAVRVGTVDKFQGQEATVSFFSMASSSGEDVPRGLEFLFSSNRLNVAVSRARCLAYVVASPRLLDANPRTVEQMRLINALCRFVELSDAA